MVGSIVLISKVLADDSSSGVAALGVNLKSLILQIITFVLVFWLLKKFALDKIVSALDERRRTIDQGVELGQRMAAEKERLDAEVEKILHAAREQADKIIASGREDIAAMLKQTEEAAARKAESLMNDARSRMDDELAKARKQLEKETVALIAEATEAIIGERLDKAKDSQIIAKALREAK